MVEKSSGHSIMLASGAGCSTCGKPTAFSVSYRRLTGKKTRRRSITTRYACAECGVRFARRYNLALPCTCGLDEFRLRVGNDSRMGHPASCPRSANEVSLTRLGEEAPGITGEEHGA